MSPTSTPISYCRHAISNGRARPVSARCCCKTCDFDSAGREQPDFPLNRPQWPEAKIIVAGRNFGCGSSREAAVYALFDYGIHCVIAPSFGDIFAGNAIQNGLLTAAVPDDVAAELMAQLTTTPETPVTVDLEQQTITCGNHNYGFTIDPVRRLRLLNGWDDIALTESFSDRIRGIQSGGSRQPHMGGAV